MNKSPLVEKWQKTTGITTYGEIRPTNVVPVIASKRSGEKAVFPMKWGFSGRTLLMNACTETAPVKATFRDAWASHRCIVPASWYFEWEHIIGNDGKKRTGDKYLIQPKGSPMTWLCGLYRIEDRRHLCAGHIGGSQLHRMGARRVKGPGGRGGTKLELEGIACSIEVSSDGLIRPVTLCTNHDKEAGP